MAVFRVLVLLLAVGTLGRGFGAETNEVFKNVAVAQKAVFPEEVVKGGWTCTARGGKVIATTAVREYDRNGELSSWNSTAYSSSRAGTVLAAPIGDFRIDRAFLYEDGAGHTLTGLVVSVEVQISSGSDYAKQDAMERTVQNLINTGIALPSEVGGKPMHLMPLKSVAAKRFGARLAKPKTVPAQNRVAFFLQDCRAEKADETYLPATPKGMTRKQREAQAALEKIEDKGGTRIFHNETEIHPAGSPYAPQGFEGDPQVIWK